MDVSGSPEPVSLNRPPYRPPIGLPVAPEDRWRIAGYVRALQLSRNAPIDRLPENVRKELDASVATTTQPAATLGGARQ